ncbi:MAG TPA: GNAT family N-acetyltransferase [Blastocatellia bacterium]|jgi:phosphinothricin acetyltransferase|nr:GNAT family N-acetyltransferase [Blastocatellia bacterium]
MDFVIDSMRPRDWESVRAIYLEGIATGQATFETEAPDWEQWDSSHLPQCRLVARNGDAVLGWAALSPVSKRQVYAGVAEVSVYVASAARGGGVGRALMRALIEASEQRGVWTLQSSVFPENHASVTLHLNYGFREVGRRERIARHHGVWRDTVILERRSLVIE